MESNKAYLDGINRVLADCDEDTARTYLSILKYSGFDKEKADKHFDKLKREGVLYLSEVLPGCTLDEFGWVIQ